MDKKGQPPVEEQMLQVSAIVIVSERERSEEEEDRSLTDCSLFAPESNIVQQIEYFRLPIASF